MNSMLREFVIMNSPTFLGSKVEEDAQEFLDGVYKVLSAIRVASGGKAKLGSHQLRNVSQVWYTQWRYNRTIESGYIEWE